MFWGLKFAGYAANLRRYMTSETDVRDEKSAIVLKGLSR